jgi:hypothetical protein
MIYTQKMFGLELRSKLASGYDYNQISDWAFRLYHDPDLDLDKNLTMYVLKLIAMQEGAEFILSDQELELMANENIESKQPMKITTDEVKSMFSDLIEENHSRKNISKLASRFLQANDNDQLEYEPLKDKEKLWSALKYLLEVDMRGGNDEYLRSTSDLIDFAKKLGL